MWETLMADRHYEVVGGSIEASSREVAQTRLNAVTPILVAPLTDGFLGQRLVIP